MSQRKQGNFPYDPWCNTCGKDIPMSVWNENDGECDNCFEWWEKNKDTGGWGKMK